MMSTKVFLLAITGLAMTLAAVYLVSRAPEPVVVQSRLGDLPLEIGQFRGMEDAYPQTVYRELNADANIYRHYRAENGRKVDLYIGYYGTAKGGRTGHNPYACLPGAGWAIVDSEKVDIPLSSRAGKVAVNFIQASREGTSTLLMHWYQAAGKKVLHSGFQQNLERFRGRLLHNRNDGAYIQVSATVYGGHVEEAKRDMTQFAGMLIPLLPDYWTTEE